MMENTISIKAEMPDELQQTLQMILDKQEDIERKLNEIYSGKEEELITIKEAAAFLHLSVDRVKRLCYSHSLPFYKHGKKSFFKKEELEAVIISRREPTNEELRRNPAKYGRQLMNNSNNK